MSGNGSSHGKFSAGSSLIGYLYQVRLGLLLSLRRLARADRFSVLFETLDDVVFEDGGEPTQLLQVKHHQGRPANLTDASPDFWKSLRVWMEARDSSEAARRAELLLVTTSEVPESSALALLTSRDRDAAEAAKRLLVTSQVSGNKTNEAAYTLFRGLQPRERKELLESVRIVTGSPQMGDLDEALSAEVWIAVRREHKDAFLRRLEGWWYRRSVEHLTGASSVPILSEELDHQRSELSEQFKKDSLPVDDDIIEALVDTAAFKDSAFVEQAKLAGMKYKRVLIAITNFYRAFEQRSRWVREDLLLVGELTAYERRLMEEWEIAFEQAKDELGETAAEDEKVRAAKQVYKWAENCTLQIRPGVEHSSMSRGSLQMLADRMEIGWHPDFLSRLRHLLEPEEV